MSKKKAEGYLPNIKPKPEISQIHDKFFKANMSKHEVITDFLQSYLPEQVQKYIDFFSITQLEPRNISRKLKLQEADLLFRLMINGSPCYLLLLMEHKSYQDRHTPIQILRYIIEIWEKEWQEKKKISPILPLVFYQGTKKWKYPQLKTYLPIDFPKEMQIYLPLYEALFYDFSLEENAELKGHKIELELFLRIIRIIYQQDRQVFQREIIEIFRDISHFHPEQMIEYMERTISYFSIVRSEIEDEELLKLAQKAGGEKVMETIWDRMEQRMEQRIAQRVEARWRKIGQQEGRQEGIQEGIQEGRQEGRREGRQEEKLSLARKMKENHFTIEQIIYYTELTEEEILAL